MKVKFVGGPSVKASTISTGAGFDGISRTCVAFEKTKVGLRCARYKKGRGHPVCDSRLVDGGRSPGLVRGKKCQRKSRKAKR
jgi:hypothetical protein